MKYAMGSLRFSLDEDGAPYYQQLITQIQQGIVLGELSVGDKLPSTRFLAESLGVSRSTTSRAYDQLLAEGVLISKEKRGVFVSALTMVGRRKPSANDKRASQSKRQSQQTKKLSFDAGVDVSVFPTKEWAASMRRSWLNPDLDLLQGGYSTGYPDLKEAIVDYLYRVRGLECTAEQIIVTAGNRDSLILLQHAITSLLESQSSETAEKEAVTWWLESPTYPPMREVLSPKSNIHNIAIDEDGPCLPEEAAINVGIITPNRQYPLGTNISSKRRQEWLQKLQQSSSEWWLVEDDYDNEFVYQGRSDVPFMQTASIHETARDRVFFVGSFSKVMFRGLRLGFIVAPLKHMDLVRQSQATLGPSSSLPIQPAVADFMLQGCFDRHINRMRRHYRIKRDFLLALLDDKLSEWFDWKKPRGGMHILIEFKPAVLNAFPELCLDAVIASDLRLQNLHLFTLSSHYVETPSPRQGFLLGFSGPSESTMEKLIDELQLWLSKAFHPNSSSS